MNISNNPQNFQLIPLNSMSLLDAAKAYAAMGYRVFPVQPNGKAPIPGWGSWKQYATRDLARLEQFWTAVPDANIAIVMGEGYSICSDLDRKGGDDGWASYFEVAGGPPQGPLQITPSGGYHALHQYVPGLKNFTHKGAHGGIDMRTDNGYIVAAPSTIDGKRYEWLQDGPLQPLPQSAVDIYRTWAAGSSVEKTQRPEPADSGTLRPLADLPIKQSVLDFLTRGDASGYGGDRSAALLGAASSLYLLGYSDEEVLAYLQDSYAWDVAQEHRPVGDALDWLWEYTCLKARSNRRISEEDAFDGIAELEARVGVTR